MGLGPFEAMEHRRQRIQQVDENSARLAKAFAMYDSTGWGEFTVPTVFDFGLTFVEEPSVSYGYALDGDTLVDTRFPRCWGGVYKWKLDIKGFYTGAWVFFIVETQSSFIDTGEADPNYDINHYFTFEGVAYKDLPAYLLDD